MAYQIRGIVSLYNRVQERICQPLSNDEKTDLAQTIKRSVLKIEELCKQCNMMIEDLPARSRSSYYYLKDFDITKIKVPNKLQELESYPQFDPECATIFSKVYTDLFKRKPPNIVVEYYPYTTIKSTIRKRKGTIYARISDVLGSAPYKVKKSMGVILLCKTEGVKCPTEPAQTFREYLCSQKVRKIHQQLRRKRSVKLTLGSKGKYWDLDDSFDRVNKKYFGGNLKKPILTWSERKTRYRLGHQDDAMDTVVISKTLDSRNVPLYALDYIMYHELLHVKHGCVYSNGRRHVHTKAFKDDEQKFEKYVEAKKWLRGKEKGKASDNYATERHDTKIRDLPQVPSHRHMFEIIINKRKYTILKCKKCGKIKKVWKI
jgi:hypothetical protein